MKKELNKKIIEICEEAGTAAAAQKCGEIMDELDREYDARIESGMTQIEAYRDVLGRLDEIKKLVESLPAEESEEEEADRRQGHKTLKRIIDKVESIMWVASAPLYLLMSFSTHKWKYTWLMFLVFALVQVILDTVVDSNDGKKDRRKVINGGKSAILWIFTTLLYFIISFATHRWAITWIIFIGAVIVQIAMDKKEE